MKEYSRVYSAMAALGVSKSPIIFIAIVSAGFSNINLTYSKGHWAAKSPTVGLRC